MYRRVIEHPTWIPEEWLARLDVRAGQDQGRIYRVYQEGYKPTNKLSMANASIDALVRMLGDESAAIADLAQQQLIWNHASNQKLTELLQTELRQSDSPRTRVRAIAILLYLNKMSSSDWRTAMEDKDARVLKFALHGMSRIDSLPSDTSTLIRLALNSSHAKTDPSVAMELVFMGGNYAPDAVNSVVQLLKTHHRVRGMDTLVDFVANEKVDNLVDALLFESDDSTNIYLERLIPRVSAQGQSRIVKSIEQSTGERPAWHYRFARQLSKQTKTTTTISTSVLDSLHQQAKATLVREDSPAVSKNAALEFCLSKMSDASTEEMESLLNLAQRVVDKDFSGGILDGVYRLGSGTYSRLLKFCMDASPANKSKIVSLMVSQPKSAKLLLEAMVTNQLDLKSVQPSQIEYLRSQKDSELKKLVITLFGKDDATNRSELLAVYASQWPKDSSIENGRKMFEQQCVVCHRERDVQGEKQPSVGPALEALNHWTNEAWLVAILDPSRSVDTKYQRVLLRTTSDEVVSGLVLRDVNGTLEVMTTDGRVQQIDRSTIEEEKTSTLSLMPDGFEKVLTPQHVSDIVRFLRSQKQ
jgi:putative heme-binding domain-containing protein